MPAPVSGHKAFSIILNVLMMLFKSLVKVVGHTGIQYSSVLIRQNVNLIRMPAFIMHLGKIQKILRFTQNDNDNRLIIAFKKNPFK